MNRAEAGVMLRFALMALAVGVCAVASHGAAGPAADAFPSPTLADRLSPERLDEIVRGARVAGLSRERAAAAAEISEGIVFDAAKTAAAVEMLRTDPAHTPADNVERITRAFVMVAPRLDEPTKLASAGRHAEAVAAVEAIIIPDRISYLDAVKLMLRADSLMAAGLHGRAARAYVEIVRAMPQYVSFAAMAAMKAGAAYERIGRMLYAMQVYQWWIDNYAFLDQSKAAHLAAKVEAIGAQYDRPLLTLAEKMQQISGRLAAGDSGPGVQATEDEIIAMLDDLIGMAEDQGDGDDGGGDRRSDSSQGSPSGDTPSEPGGESGPAKGLSSNPTAAAAAGTLPGAMVAEPTSLSGAGPRGGGAWGRLPARKREELIETFGQRYPQRYTEMLEAYYRRLSEQK